MIDSEIRQRWFNHLKRLLLPGRQEELELFFCCCLSMVVVSKGLLMIWLFLDQLVKCPQLPFILCKALGLLSCFCSETKLNFRCPAENLRLNQSSLLWVFSETLVLTSSEISNMCFLLYDKKYSNWKLLECCYSRVKTCNGNFCSVASVIKCKHKFYAACWSYNSWTRYTMDFYMSYTSENPFFKSLSLKFSISF